MYIVQLFQLNPIIQFAYKKSLASLVGEDTWWDLLPLRQSHTIVLSTLATFLYVLSIQNPISNNLNDAHSHNKLLPIKCMDIQFKEAIWSKPQECLDKNKSWLCTISFARHQNMYECIIWNKYHTEDMCY